MSLTALWNVILDTYSEPQIQFFGTMAVQLTCFWALSLFYISLPYTFPKFSARHKLQKEEKQPTKADLWECFKVALRNQTFTWILQGADLWYSSKQGKQGDLRFDRTLPGLGEVLQELILASIMREIMFYYVHRLLHTKTLYPIFHKKHHKFVFRIIVRLTYLTEMLLCRFTAPVALAGQYATFTEHLFANVAPVIIPCTIMKSHAVTMYLFLAKELIAASTTHSGYDFLNGWARFHDMHHEKFNVAFGSLGLMDILHHTDGKEILEKKKADAQKLAWDRQQARQAALVGLIGEEPGILTLKSDIIAEDSEGISGYLKTM
ncbi:hypothetical protein HWV62_6189 [Athelia sp. TMB]|nr:hypothetical protein HWV62_6189 [Athelia sp. TMB]